MAGRPLVCHVLYSGLGGHGSVVFSCLAADASSEFDHCVLFLGVEPVLPAYLRVCDSFGVAHAYVAKKPRGDFSAQSQLFRQLRAWKPRTVLLHSGYAALPAAVAYRTLSVDTRLVYIEHTPNHQKARVEWLGSILAPWVADKVVYLTEASMREIRVRTGRLFRPQRACVIPNGIDARVFSARPGLRGELPFQIGMQARMTLGKDQATLIHALESLRNSEWFERLRLRFAGTGPTELELRRLVQRLGLEAKVEFLGMLDEPALVDFLGSLDVYVHSTKGETLSTAILQAQSSALPVIASDVAGVRGSIEHGLDGLLVEPGNPDVLAEAMVSVLSKPELALGLGQAGAARIRGEFTQEKMWARYRSVVLE